MTLAITHAKQSLLADDGQSQEVQPSDWNAAHVLTGTASPAQGGTGLSGYTIGDLLVASSAAALAALADVATGNVLLSGGIAAAPAWGKVGLTTHVTGTLPAGNGGTGIASYAVGDLLYASGATALSKLADVAAGSVLVSGGVGVAPAWSSSPALASGGKYGFAGVLNAVALNGVATAIQAADGGNYFYVTAGQVLVNSASFILANAGTPVIAMPTPAVTGQLVMTNGAGTAGVGLDIATDAVMKVRTRAQTGYATVDALGYSVSGVSGASRGAGSVTSITVVNGIVTAIS